MSLERKQKKLFRNPDVRRSTFTTHHTFADTASLASTPALGTQSIELVEEDDARRGRPCPLEHLADGLLRLPDVLVQQLRA